MLHVYGICHFDPFGVFCVQYTVRWNLIESGSNETWKVDQSDICHVVITSQAVNFSQFDSANQYLSRTSQLEIDDFFYHFNVAL